MPHYQEWSVGGLIVRVDRTLCVGFGDCITPGAEAFELDDEGIAVLLPGAGELARPRLLEACDACPVDAITVLDTDGRQLVP